MALSRMFASLSNRLSEGPFVSEEPNLPSGGHSGYRPEDYRTQSRRVRSQGLYRNQGQQPLGYSGSFTMPQLSAGTTSVQPVMNVTGTVPQTVMGYMGTAPQPVVNSGMNAVPGTAPQPAYPPVRQGYPAAQQGYPAAQQPQGYPAMQQGYPQARQPAYPPAQQPAYPQAQQGYPAQNVPAQATVPQPPVQDHGRRKGAQAPTDYSMSSYSGAIPQMPAGYQQNWPQREQKPYQSKFRQEAPAPQQPERNRRAFQPQAQPPVPQPQPQMQPQMPLFQPQANNPVAQIPQNPNAAQPLRREGNVTYMPNLYVGNDGAAYRHVERLTQPMSASTCYRLIEFMRPGPALRRGLHDELQLHPDLRQEHLPDRAVHGLRHLLRVHPADERAGPGGPLARQRQCSAQREPPAAHAGLRQRPRSAVSGTGRPCARRKPGAP